VIGSGIAGLNFALLAAEHGRVVVITKKAPDDTNTNWAQGGVAAVLASHDSFEQHIEDTLVAGDGLCDREVVERCVLAGPASVQRLLDLGVRLARNPEGQLDLGREGAHTHHRVVHWQDVTGREIQRALLESVARESNITILDEHIAVDLLSMAKYGGDPACFGAYVLDRRSGEVKTILARATVLASGGTGKVFLYTSNPDVATGDGVAMAYRLGAACCDLEFVQFHPTVLYHPHARNFLLTEAMRGEGGVLRLASGETFMENYHPMKSLASRDIVARAIDNELKKSGADSVFLDMTHLDPGFVRGRFPNIYERCLPLGIDITRQPIPVVPAAHYMCGGIKTDLNGQSTVTGLYAIGECAFTGLHGANRLASTSLLEGLLWGFRGAEAAVSELGEAVLPEPGDLAQWRKPEEPEPTDPLLIDQDWGLIRSTLWNYAGIVRTGTRLVRAKADLHYLNHRIERFYHEASLSRELLELRSGILCARLILNAALQNPESRGCHYRVE